MTREAVISRDGNMLERDGALLLNASGKSFHVFVILVVSFDEEDWAVAQRVRPLNIVPIFGMLLRFCKKLRRRGALHWMQLCVPAF